MPYPVTFEADYVEKRSRLTTLFRWILAIPHLIVIIVYAFAAYVVVIIAWFALLFTGRWPRGMYDFEAGFWRYATAVYGYIFLLTDEYPPFGPDVDAYPVRLTIAPPKGEYSRLKVLFRIILAIPPYLISYALGIVAQVGAFLSWFAIIFLGRQPKGLQDMIVLGLSYQQRAYTYLFLITEDWPPFTDDSSRQVEAAPAFGSLPPQQQPEAATSVAPGGFAEPSAAEPEAPPPPPLPTGGPEAPPPPSQGDPLGGQAAPPAPPPPTAPDDDDDEEEPPGPFGPSSTPSP